MLLINLIKMFPFVRKYINILLDICLLKAVTVNTLNIVPVILKKT